MENVNRFTSKTNDYVAARPSYPSECIDFISKSLLPVMKERKVVEIGAGTGIMTRLLASSRSFHTIECIEPNEDMRNVFTESMDDFMLNNNEISQICSVKLSAAGDRAESAASLLDKCCEAIIVAQSFHWFDDSCADEFTRLLKNTDGSERVVLVWNRRSSTIDDFHKDFEELLQTLESYRELTHRQLSNNIHLLESKLGRVCCDYQHIPFQQQLHANNAYEHLKKRVLSSSYSPEETSEEGMRFFDSLFALYEKHEPSSICYETRTFVFGGTHKTQLQSYLKKIELSSVITFDHEPIVTCEEHEEVLKGREGKACRNLCVRSKKSQKLFLITGLADEKIDLRSVEKELNLNKKDALRLAPDEVMQSIFGVRRGALTPFAYYLASSIALSASSSSSPPLSSSNADELPLFLLHANVANLDPRTMLFFHPLVNNATTAISLEDLQEFLVKAKVQTKIILNDTP